MLIAFTTYEVIGHIVETSGVVGIKAEFQGYE